MSLMELLPQGIYTDNVTMQELQNILEGLVNRLSDESSNAVNNCFITSADKLLSRYEMIFGIEAGVDTPENSAHRIERIKAKIKGTGTITKQMIIDTASCFAGGEATVIEYPEESRFVIKFIGVKGIPANMEGLTDTINEIKPCHLAFSYDYTYNVWNMLENETWSGLGGMTWSEVKTY